MMIDGVFVFGAGIGVQDGKFYINGADYSVLLQRLRIFWEQRNGLILQSPG